MSALVQLPNQTTEDYNEQFGLLRELSVLPFPLSKNYSAPEQPGTTKVSFPKHHKFIKLYSECPVDNMYIKFQVTIPKYLKEYFAILNLLLSKNS